MAYFAASWAAVLQHLLTQRKLQFKKKLRRSSTLLIIVAMDQSGCNSNMVRVLKQDLASPSMMICYQFSLRASWIAQSPATASACSGEHHSCILAQTLRTSPFLILATTGKAVTLSDTATSTLSLIHPSFGASQTFKLLSKRIENC